VQTTHIRSTKWAFIPICSPISVRYGVFVGGLDTFLIFVVLETTV